MAYSCARWHCTGGEGEGGRDTVNEDKPLKKRGNGKKKEKRRKQSLRNFTKQCCRCVVVDVLALRKQRASRNAFDQCAEFGSTRRYCATLKFGKKKEK